MKLLVTAVFTVLLYSIALSQTDREFWFVAPEVTTTHYDFKYYTEYNKEYRGGEPTFFRISTRELASTVTIEMPANEANFPPVTLTIPPNSTQSINLTDLVGQDQIENKYENGGLSNKGIHITSTELVTIYYEVATRNNTDLFALKGKNALGTEFYCPFQNIAKNNDRWRLHWKAADLGEQYPTPAYSAIDIVATHDNTQVWIIPTKRTFDGKLPGVPYMVSLDAGETYSVGPEAYVPTWYGGQSTFSPYPEDRLAGTKITSNYPIAITISDDSMKFPGNGCYDLFGDQLIPTSIIGFEYIALRGQLDMANRAAGMSGEQLYILATEDATPIYVNGVLKTFLNEGDTYFYEFADTDYAVHVTSDADHPFYVLHISGFGCEMGGAFLPPTSACTGSTQIGFTRSTSAGFFLNLMVRKDAFDGFILNGNPILTNLADWTAIPTDPNWVATIVDYTDGTDIPVNVQSLIVNTKDIFHMGVINGNRTGGCRFGYFSDYNKLEIDAITTNTETGNIRTCWGEAVQLQAEGGTNFHWTPHDFLDDPYSQTPLSHPRGNIKYTVSVSGACDMVGTADVTIEVAPRVEAIYTIDTTEACSPYEFTFYNSSTGATDENKWDFGDSIAPIDDPSPEVKYTFNNDGDSVKVFNVMLVTKNLESCRDTMRRDVFVYPNINAEMSASITEACAPVTVDFTNTSTGARGDKPYLWEFDDEAASSLESPTHTFNNLSSDDTVYTVQLVTSNQYYCTDTTTVDILVHPYIKADYAVAPTETCTPYNAEIADKSVGADTYRWDYGDGATGNDATATHDHLYDNTTANTEIYPLSLIVDNDEGCSDTLVRNMTIHPFINADFDASSLIVCDNTEISFTNTSDGASSYFWDFGDESTSITENPNHTYRNLTSTSVVYTVTLIVSASNGVCADTITQDITVHPFLSAQFNFAPATGCSPHTVDITNTSEGVDTYQWIFGDGETSTTAASDFSHTYTNNTLLTRQYQLRLITSNNEGCTAEMDKNITIFPPITADFTTSADAICDSGVVIFTNTSSGASDYQWSFGDGASSSDINTNHVYRNLTANTEVLTVQLIANANNNACADTIQKTVSVYPQLKANFGLSASSGCTPFTVDVEDASIQADVYNWTLSDGTTFTTNGDISHEFTNDENSPKDYTIQLAVENTDQCTSELTKTITVFPKVTATFTTSDGCSPHEISNFQNTSQNASIYQWNFGDNTSSNEASPDHTFKNFSADTDEDFTVTLRAESEYGCFDERSETLTVYYAPIADFNIGEAAGCSPYDITITNNTVGGIDYLWDFGDGRATETWSDPSFTITYTNNGRDIETYPITLTTTSNNACVSVVSRNAVIYPAITSEFTVSDGCYPHSISNFNNTSVGAVSYNWDFGDGVTSNEQNPTHLFQNFSQDVDSVYTVTLETTSPNGCTAQSNHTVTVFPKPTASFEIGDATGCSPYSVDITHTALGADDYDWDMGDGSSHTQSVATFSHDYFNSTRDIILYPVTLIVSNNEGCSDTLERKAAIYPDIKAEFEAFSGCHPHTIADFNNTSVGALSYDWDFGDELSSSIESPSHTFTNFSKENDSVFTITLTATSLNGCTSTHDTTITVYHKPFAEFSITDNEGCSPHTTPIVNQTIGATQLLWDFGDGTTGNETVATFDHLFTNATGSTQNYAVNLIAITNNNCSDTITRNTTIFSDISAEFSIESGCHPHYLSSFNNTSIGADIYNWDFGDAQSSNEQNPEHLYSNFSNIVDSVYTVTLKTESVNGCKAEKDTLITIYPKPKAEFLITNPEACSPHTIEIENSSLGVTTGSWDYADGSALEQTNNATVQHLYTNTSGASIVFPVVFIGETEHGCLDTISRNATIHSEVHISFEAESGCHPHTISDFNNTTVGADIYNWTFGDNQSSNEESPSHSYSNVSTTNDSTYTIALHAESIYGCFDDKDTTITVYHKPEAEFSVDNTPGCSPYPVSFTNKSKGHSEILWSYGDGVDSSSVDNSVTHVYVNETGDVVDYDVQIIAITDNNCTDTINRFAKVYPSITASFSVEGGCSPLTISNFNNSSQWVDEYQWTMGDGASSNIADPTHTFRNFTRDADANYTIELETRNRFGCTAFYDTTITILYKPKAQFSITNSPGCSPYTIEIDELAQGTDSCYWSFGDSTYQVETTNHSVSHEYNHDGPEIGIFPIQLISRTNSGCSDTITRNATIYPNISSEFSAKPAACSPFTVQFYNDSYGVELTEWDFGDGNVSNVFDPTNTYMNYSNTELANFTVTLTNESKFGCTARSEMEITVYPNPKPVFSVLNSPGCSPHVIDLDNTTIGADIMLWDFADGTTLVDSLTGLVQHEYQHADDDLQRNVIEQVAMTNYGCSDTITQSAVIYPDISSSFIVNMEGCNPLTVTTQNESQGVDQYVWDFGDGGSSNQENNTHIYYNFDPEKDSVFTISLATTSKYDCKAFSDTTVTVYPVPQADFAVEKDNGCSPFTVPFTNLSEGAVEYRWTYNDDSPYDEIANPTHVFNNQTEDVIKRQVKLRVTNLQNCVDSIEKTITVYPEVTAEFSGDFDGCHPHLVEFVNESKLAQYYEWDLGYGDARTSDEPYKYFENNTTEPITIPVSLLVRSIYECEHISTDQVTVYPSPDADFSIDSSKLIFPTSDIGKATVNIFDETNAGDWNYHWNYGDGSTSDSIGSHAHNYTTWNNFGEHFLITLTVNNTYGCEDTASRKIVVTSPKPEAMFTIDSDNGCPPHEVTFTNEAAYGNSVRWQFGDNTESKDSIATHTYDRTGTYHVIFEVYGDGGVTTADTVIEIHQMPIVNFTIENPLLTLPADSLRTRNLSSYGERYLWDFGDGAQSAEFAPSHLYTDKGLYDINLTVWTKNDCRSDSTAINAVTVQAPCDIEFPNAFTPNPNESNGGAYKGLEATNDIFFPAVLEEGVVEYQLEIYNKWGEMIFETEDKLIGWDGYYRGQLSQMDVYVWKLKATCADGREIKQVGDVTLLR